MKQTCCRRGAAGHHTGQLVLWRRATWRAQVPAVVLIGIPLFEARLPPARPSALLQSPHYTPQPSPMQMFDLHWRASSEGEAAGRQAGLAPSGDHSAALGGSSGELAEGSAAGAAWVGPEEGRNGHQNPVTPAQQRAVGGPQSGGSGEDSSGGEGEGEGPGRVPSQAISAALATELSAPLSAVDMGASPGVPGSLSPLGEAGAPGAERSEGHAVHAEAEAADEERAALLPPGLPLIETKVRASVDGGHVASPLGAGGPADDEARTAQLASLAEQVGGGREFGVGWGAGCAADEQVGICMIGARWARHIRFCVPGQWRQH